MGVRGIFYFSFFSSSISFEFLLLCVGIVFVTKETMYLFMCVLFNIYYITW